MKIERAKAIKERLNGKPEYLRRKIIQDFAREHFISERTIYDDLKKLCSLRKGK